MNAGSVQVNRRQTVATLMAAFAPVSRLSAQTAQGAEKTAEQWMSAWMGVGRPVSGPLHIGRFYDPMYFLLLPISWKPALAQDGREVVVPKGFVTDFASIPRLFWSILRPDGEYTYPAIIHDYLYWMQDRPRQEADDVFRSAMGDFSIDAPTANSIYLAVRAGGQSAWDTNHRLRVSGEKRVLRIFPEDPRVSWETYKLDPAVFIS